MNTFQREIAFPSSLHLALDTLVEMQKSLNKYRLKQNANQKWAEERQQSIARLMEFVEVSQQTIEELAEEINSVKSTAYKRGYEKAKKEIKHKEEYGDLRFHNPAHKERIRAASILNAQEKWNF